MGLECLFDAGTCTGDGIRGFKGGDEGVEESVRARARHFSPIIGVLAWINREC